MLVLAKRLSSKNLSCESPPNVLGPSILRDFNSKPAFDFRIVGKPTIHTNGSNPAAPLRFVPTSRLWETFLRVRWLTENAK